MEEQKDKKMMCDCASCRCGCGMMHGHGAWGGYMVFRVLLAIVVVVAAFWIGLKLGELQSAYYNAGYRGGEGRTMMMRGYPMMGGYGAAVPTTQAAPSATATPTK